MPPRIFDMGRNAEPDVFDGQAERLRFHLNFDASEFQRAMGRLGEAFSAAALSTREVDAAMATFGIAAGSPPRADVLDNEPTKIYWPVSEAPKLKPPPEPEPKRRVTRRIDL